jgi:hypothetical protein
MNELRYTNGTAFLSTECKENMTIFGISFGVIRFIIMLNFCFILTNTMEPPLRAVVFAIS